MGWKLDGLTFESCPGLSRLFRYRKGDVWGAMFGGSCCKERGANVARESWGFIGVYITP